MGKQLNKWLFDYKLLHVFFWCLIGFFLYLSDYDTDYNQGLYIGQSILVPLISCIPFYLTAYYLVPRYLYQKKYLKLISSLLAILVVLVPCQIILSRFILHFVDNRLSTIPQRDDIISIFYMGVWNNLLCIFIGGGLKIMSDRFKLEKEKINTELNFLRAQINPHFLFNMLNTIYFQVDKSNFQARASIEKMSEMLRYQLYECVHDSIEIEKEIKYLESYVMMQKLRFEEGTDIQFQIDESLKSFFIAPLLLQPLVENAFKFLSQHKDPRKNILHISLQQKENRLVALISNTEDAAHNTDLLVKMGGIGYKNLHRRLELLYPGMYQLETQRNEGRYTVKLSVCLHKNNEVYANIKPVNTDVLFSSPVAFTVNVQDS